MSYGMTIRHMELHRNILSELGHSLESGAHILDFGCGAGSMVEEYCQAGYNAFGADILVEHESERVRRIEQEPYRIPFGDNRFDFVFCDQVLEHVQDHACVFAEMNRVMKPGAISLHIFPPQTETCGKPCVRSV